MTEDNKAVMLSVRPQWCELIAAGRKTIDVRKTKPKIERPFKCYIYCTNGKSFYIFNERFECETKGNGKVIGEFVCRLITGLRANNGIQTYYNGTLGTCLTDKEIIDYAKGKMIYYWHISDLKIYDNPKELSEFGLKRPPQSWCYVEELE